MTSLQELNDGTARLIANHFAKDPTYQVAVERGLIFVRTHDQIFKLAVSEVQGIGSVAAAEAFMADKDHLIPPDTI